MCPYEKEDFLGHLQGIEMSNLRKYLMVGILLASSLAAKEELPYKAERVFIGSQGSNQIEFYLAKPEGRGPFPLMFVLHGYQPPENSLGGKELVGFGYLQRFVTNGIAAVSISLPGHGASDGERDFSGPSSQKAILAVIENCKNLPFVDASKMGIYGISRGAILAGMVSALCPDLQLQILESGEYDLTLGRSNLPDYLSSLRENLFIESGGTFEDLLARSCLYHTYSMHQTTLILHGEFDNRKGLESAIALQEKLIDQGVKSFLKVFPDGLHTLPPEKWELIIPFVKEQFFGIGGIGINVTQMGHVLQISKVHPMSPAAKSDRIKVGDTILSISAGNGEEMENALDFSVNQFIARVLGPKGAPLRLQVQHFDDSIEEVVLERGMF